MFEKILNHFHYSLQTLNNSKFFAGLMILIVNIGSRYVTIKFSKSQEEYIKNKVAREFLIFAIVWMATRDLYISILMTAAFIILADYLFNENSNMCILPEKYKNIQYLIDTNNDNIIQKQCFYPIRFLTPPYCVPIFESNFSKTNYFFSAR